jgi:tetratricopeptide (TPR) repeat protein
MTATSPISNMTISREIDQKYDDPRADDPSAREFKMARAQAEGNADGETTAKEPTAKELMDAGQAYRELGNLIAAAKRFNAAGYAYKGDDKKAAEAFKEAAEAYRKEASLASRQDQEAAKALYGQAAENYSLSANSHLWGGNVRSSVEMTTMAASCLSHVDKQSAYDLYQAAGDAFRQLGDEARAAEAYKNADSLRPRGR